MSSGQPQTLADVVSLLASLQKNNFQNCIIYDVFDKVVGIRKKQFTFIYKLTKYKFEEEGEKVEVYIGKNKYIAPTSSLFNIFEKLFDKFSERNK